MEKMDKSAIIAFSITVISGISSLVVFAMNSFKFNGTILFLGALCLVSLFVGIYIDNKSLSNKKEEETEEIEEKDETEEETDEESSEDESEDEESEEENDDEEVVEEEKKDGI